MPKLPKFAVEIKEEGGLLPAFLLLGLWAALLLVPDTQLLDLKRALAFAWVSAALGLLAWRVAQGKPSALPKLRFRLLVGTLVLVYALASSLGPYPNAGNYRIEVLVLGVFFALFAAGLPETVRERWPAVTLAAAALVAIYALLQRCGIEPIAAYRLAGSADRAMGPFGNAGFLAAFLCFVWPLSLLWHDRRRPALFVLLTLALLATQSRAGLVALAAQLLLLGIQAWKEGLRPRLAPLALGLLMTVAAVAWLFPWAAWLRPTLRWPLWSESLRLFLQRPWLGWGPGSFPLALQEHGSAAFNAALGGTQYAEHPHQWLLSIAVEAGLLGLAAWAALLGTIQPWPRTDLRRSPLQRAVALGLFGLLVENLFDRNLDQAALSSCFFFGLGLLYQGEPAAPKVNRRWLALPVLFLALNFAWLGLQPVLAYRTAVAAEPVSTAVHADELRKIVAENPTDPGALDRLASVLASQGSFEEAARALESAYRLQASPGRAQNLGNCFMELGRPAEAEARYRMGLLLGPASADLHFSLGYALFKQKKLKPALTELDAALKLEPGHAGAAKLKEQILR